MAFPENDYQKERRLVTILFADLSGFTSLSEKLDPEELSESLNVCFEILNRIITDYEGIIHKYEGDSVLAIFGLPQSHEDDPERGVGAALEMMERIPEINKALSAKLRIDCVLGLHAGINLGTVFAGAIGSKEKQEYTIIGEAVNMASRLMDAADNGVILVSGRVFRQTRYLYEYKPLKPIKVKGISKPVQVFQPLKRKDTPDPKRGIEGLKSKMVGRKKEFALLCERIDQLVDNKQSSVTFITGDAGIGKSRLLEELISYIDSKSLAINILEGRCLSYGESITHFPVLEVLKKLFHITDQESADAIRKKIITTVQQILPKTSKEIVPYIYYLFSVPLPAEFKDKVKHLDAEGLKIQMSVAIKDVLEATADKHPVLVVIDDYHWIDSASLDLLKFIFDASGKKPLSLLCLSRIEKESEGYRVKDHLKKCYNEAFTEVELTILSNEASKEMTMNLLKHAGIIPEVHQEILRKAEGNPLYLEEIIRSLIDAGMLVKELGVWKSSNNLTVEVIPDSIQEIIVTRLDSLDSDVKKVLQKASVIGRSFLVPLLERLTSLDSLIMSVHLATLEELEYIVLLNKEPELEYIFKHPLVQEVAYNSLPRKSRRELHGRVAKIIEDVFSNRIDEFTELVAHHYSNCDDTEKAIEWLEKAAIHAKERFANEQAITYFQKLIKDIDQLPEPSEQYKWKQLKAYEALGDVHAIHGTYEKALEAFNMMYRKSTDKVIQARALRKTAGVHFHRSDYENAQSHLGKALTMVTENSPDMRIEQAEIYLLESAVDSVQGAISESKNATLKAMETIENIKTNDRVKKIKATAMINLAGVHRNYGEYDDAIEMYDKSRVLLEELNDKQVLANVMYLLGIIYHMMGDPKKSVELSEQSLAILEQIGDKRNIGRTCSNLGVMYSYLGVGDKALTLQLKALRISIEIGDKRGEGMSYNNIARYHMGNEDYDKADDYFNKYLKIAEGIGDKTSISAALGNLAILYIRREEYDRAEEYLLRAEKIIKELGNKQLLATAYTHIADVKRRKGEPFKNVIAYIDKASDIAEEIGHKASKADCAYNYAKVYAEMKDIKKSEEYMVKATELFLELGRDMMLVTVYDNYSKILERIGETTLAKQYKDKIKKLEKKFQ